MKLIEEIEKEASKCIHCGFCEAVCPTFPKSGYRSIFGARGRVLLSEYLLKEIKKGKIKIEIADAYYSCLSCYACYHACPARVNAGKISEFSRSLIAQGYIEKKQEKAIARLIVKTTEKYLNPLALKKTNEWIKEIGIDESSETLLYFGSTYKTMAIACEIIKIKEKLGKMSSLLERILLAFPQLIRFSILFKNKELFEVMNNTSKNIAYLLKKAKVNFKVLINEPYSGILLYDLGYHEAFKRYALKLVEIFKKEKIKKIILADPHTFKLFNVIYPKLVENFDFEISYYLDYLKNLEFRQNDEIITYHEPCLFIMHELDYDLPLNLLKRTAKVVLPERHGKSSHCCGGPIAFLYPKLAKEISKDRLNQLKDTKAKKVITACPICLTHLYEQGFVEDISSFLIKNLYP